VKFFRSFVASTTSITPANLSRCSYSFPYILPERVRCIQCWGRTNYFTDDVSVETFGYSCLLVRFGSPTSFVLTDVVLTFRRVITCLTWNQRTKRERTRNACFPRLWGTFTPTHLTLAFGAIQGAPCHMTEILGRQYGPSAPKILMVIPVMDVMSFGTRSPARWSGLIVPLSCACPTTTTLRPK